MFKWLFGSGEKKKPASDEPTSMSLWDTEFTLVGKDGLNANEVIAYVDELRVRHQTSQDAQEASVRSIVQTAMTDAHEIADKIRAKAESEAAATADGVVNQGKKDAEGIKAKAEAEAHQAAERITTAADKSARLTEAEAQDKAVIFLLRAREQIEREVIGEFNEAYTRLTDALGALVGSGRDLQTDLQGRREELLKSRVFELTEGDVPLIGSPAGIAAPETDAAPEADAVPEAGAAPDTEKKPRGGKKAEDAAAVEAEAVVAEAEPVAVDEAVIEPPVVVEPVAEPAVAVSGDETAASSPEDFAELSEEETQALYIGEVDIVVPQPVDAKMMSQLHRYLQTTPEIKLVRTAGSMGRGTVVTISIDKPVPLIGALSSRIPDAAIALEQRRGDGSPGLPGATRKIRMVPRAG